MLTLLAFAFSGANLQGLLLPVMLIAVFYFLMILPNQRKQKAWQTMLAGVKSGDQVVTTGGIRGTVIAVREDTIQLRIAPDNIKLEFVKNAIATITTAEEVK